MILGFTKSKVDSNLCLKVEGRRPVMLLLCGMEAWTREVCSRDIEEVHDDGLQGYDHIYGIEHEAIE